MPRLSASIADTRARERRPVLGGLRYSGASLKLLRQTYTGRVLTTIIPRNTDIRDAHFNKQDIFTFNPRAKAAQAYDRLIGELFDL